MKRITWRAFAVATLALAAGLVAAATAGATPPTREDLGVIPYEFSVYCSPYGFAFGEQRCRRGIPSGSRRSYDAEDNAFRTVAHDSFTDDTNSMSGKTLRATARVVNTVDLVAATRTVVGKSS
jgi:hypothetical protein